MSAQETITKSPSPFTCPDCQGTLFEMKSGKLMWFQCRVGHSYSIEILVDAQDDSVERLLWGAVKALEEQSEYIARMAEWSGDDSDVAKRYKIRSSRLKKQAEVIREIVTDGTERDSR